MNTMSILIVDDDPVLCKMLRALLEQAGYEVFEAANGRQGMRSFTTHPTDMVLTDIVMPDVEGIELIMTLRRQNASLPILAMSGGNSGMGPDYLEMAEKLGATATIYKPVSPPEVLATIEQHRPRLGAE